MITVFLTVRQRFGLFNIAGTVEGKLEDLAIWNDIKEKLLITDDLRASAMKVVGTSVIEDTSVLDDLAEEFSFEKEEQRKLLNLLKTFDHFKTADFVWASPIVIALSI